MKLLSQLFDFLPDFPSPTKNNYSITAYVICVFLFSIILITSTDGPASSADTQWFFNRPEAYQFDNQFIQVQGSLASLKQKNWYDTDWPRRLKLTVKSDSVGADVQNFPVFVDLADLPTDFFNRVDSQGDDIRITKSDGTTEVPREIVSLNTADNTGELHFRASGISSTSDTSFYIYYDNPSASGYTVSDPFGAENVWTNNYEAVWHMEDQSEGVTSWFNNSWDKRIKITINGDSLPSNINDYPVYFDLGLLSSNFFNDVDSQGDDIRITRSDGVTEVPREIVSISTSGETGEIHFKAPRLNAGSDTDFYIYYENPGASGYAESDPNGAQNVWTNNFEAVWHLDETDTTTVFDATSNNRNGTILPPDWYDNDWNYRKKITINSDSVPQDVNEFPVFVDLSLLGSDFFNNVDSNGDDIRITTSDGATEVPREIVSINTSNETGEIHFKAPKLNASSDTFFFIYYDNPSATGYNESDPFGSENVWTNNFEAVWHLDETATDTAYDATANNRDGTISPPADWFNNNWDFRKAVTINGDSVAGNHSNFPVMIKTTDSELSSEAQPDGDDIVFTGSDGVTQLDHEIEQFVSDSGKLVAWVRVPTLNSGSDTELYMYYGNSGASNQENPQSVWGSEYKGVWHFAETTGSNPSDWFWDIRLDRRKKITIDHTQVESNVTDFPVLVDITDGDLASHAQSDGGDIRFVSLDGSETYPHEIESYDGGTGDLVAWVNVPNIPAGSDTSFYMYYGSSSVSNQEDTAGAWQSDYAGVWHLNETSGSARDSTNNNNNGTLFGPTRGANGLISNAFDFESSNSDSVGVTNDASLNVNYVHYSAWVNYESLVYNAGIMAKGDGSRQYWIWQYPNITTSDTSLHFGVDDVNYKSSFPYLGPNTWYKTDVIYNGSTVRTYLDGILTSSESQSTGDILNVSDDLVIGKLPGYEEWDGLIDEVRVKEGTAGDVSSEGWVKTAYNNQVANQAQESIVFDTQSSVSADYQSTVSFNHTLGQGENRLLVVKTTAEDSGSVSGNNDPVDVTYNGVSLSKAVENRVDGTSSVNVNTEIWYMLESNLPSAGSHTVTVDFSGTTRDIQVGAISVSRAAQQLPEETVANDDDGSGDTSIATTINTQTDGSWVFDVVGIGDNNSGLTPTVDGQVKSWEEVGFTSAGASSFLQDTNASNDPTLEWNLGGSNTNRVSHVLVSFAPASPASFLSVGSVQTLDQNRVKDSTSNNNDLTVLGDPGEVANTKPDSGYYFDGTNDILKEVNNSSLEPTSSITLSMWYRRDGSQKQWAKPIWYGQNNEGPWGPYGFEHNSTSDTRITFHLSNTDVLDDAFFDTTWYHLSGTYDGSTQKIFKDGNLENTNSASGSINDYDDIWGLAIGGRYEEKIFDSEDQKFQGELDEVRILDSAKSDNWIQTQYYNQNDPKNFISIGRGRWKPDQGGSGLVGRSYDFEFDDERNRVDVGNWNVPSGDSLTLQNWVNFESFDRFDARHISKAEGTANSEHTWMLSGDYNDESDIRFRLDVGGNVEELRETDGGSLSTGKWYFMNAVYDRSTMRLLRNVSEVASQGASGSIAQDNRDIFLGNNPVGNRPLDGRMDEVRISSTARSDSWLTAEYNNQLDPSGFMTIGSQDDGSGWEPDQGSSGLVGRAYDFEFDDEFNRVDVGNWNVPAGDSLTIMSWVNYESHSEINGEERLISKAGGSSTNEHTFMLSLDNNATDLRMRLHAGGSGSTLTGSSNQPLNTWLLLAGTYDRNNIRIFKNGNQEGSQSKTGNIRQDNRPIFLGNQPLDTRPLDGRLDEVRVASMGRSGGWQSTVYNNHFGTNNFFTVGSPNHRDPVFDSTSNDNDGQANTSASGNSGVLYGGRELDGTDDYLEVLDDASLDVTGNLTLSAWVQGESFTTGNNENRLVLKGPGGHTSNLYTLDIVHDDSDIANEPRASFLVDGQTPGNGAFSTSQITTNTWYHIVGSHSSDSQAIYLDGVLENSQNNTRSGSANSESLAMGGRTDGVDFLDGFMDEVRVMSDSRSRGWINTEYNNQSDPDGFYRVGNPKSFWVDTGPSIVNDTGVSFYEADTFGQVVGADHSGTVEYQISNDADSWYYYNGSSWVEASSSSQANQASIINNNLASFREDVSSGTFFFKAFLKSSSFEEVELDEVELSYQPHYIDTNTLSVGAGNDTLFRQNLDGDSSLQRFTNHTVSLTVKQADTVNLYHTNDASVATTADTKIQLSNSSADTWTGSIPRANFGAGDVINFILEAKSDNGHQTIEDSGGVGFQYNLADTGGGIEIVNPIDGSVLSDSMVYAASREFGEIDWDTIEFRVNGNLIYIRTQNDEMDRVWNTWQAGFNSTDYSNGSADLKVIGLLDDGTRDTDQITVTVDNAHPSNVTIDNPANGSIVGGTVTVDGSASDNRSIDRMLFFQDERPSLAGNGGTVQIQFNENFSQVPSVIAQVQDADNRTVVAQGQNVTETSAEIYLCGLPGDTSCGNQYEPPFRVTWLAFEPGSLPWTGSEAGITSNVTPIRDGDSNGDVESGFSFGDTPASITMIQTNNDTQQYKSVWSKNITPNQIELLYCNYRDGENWCDENVQNEDVGWFVMERGGFSNGEAGFSEVGGTNFSDPTVGAPHQDYYWRTIEFDKTYQNPVVLANANEVFYKEPPMIGELRKLRSDKMQIRMCEHRGDGSSNGFDGCDLHGEESVGWVVFELENAIQKSGVDGGYLEYIGSKQGSPSSIDWDTTKEDDGEYHLQVEAMDEAGNVTLSGTRTVFVDRTPPNIADVISPAAGSFLRDTVTIEADAGDTLTGVDTVTFRVDGSSIGTDQVGDTWTINWNTNNAGDGTHNLSVTVIDSAGNSVTVGDTTVTVDNTAPPLPSLLVPPAGSDTRADTIPFDWTTVNDGQSGMESYHIQASTDANFPDTGLAFERDIFEERYSKVHSPTTWGQIHDDWSNPDRADTNSGTNSSPSCCARSGSDLDREDYGDYEVNVPSDSVVSSVEVGLDYAFESFKNDILNVQTSTDGGSTWHEMHQVPQDGVIDEDRINWVDVTSDANWDNKTLNDTNFRVRVTHEVIGSAEFAALDYIPLRVRFAGDTPSSETAEPGLPEGDYYWRVFARDKAGNTSGYTVPDTFTIDRTAPPRLSDLASTATVDPPDTGVNLFWTFSSNDVEFFRLYRSFRNVDTSTAIQIDSVGVRPDTVTYLDSSVTRGDSYFYYVTAVDTATNEGDSSNVTAAPHITFKKTQDDTNSHRPGDTIVYTIQYVNDGFAPSGKLILEDVIPDSMTLSDTAEIVSGPSATIEYYNENSMSWQTSSFPRQAIRSIRWNIGQNIEPITTGYSGTVRLRCEFK